MDNTNNKILYTTIVIYVITMFMLIIIKPNIVYDNINKKIKTFGTNENETILSLPIVGILLCISIYFIVVMYHFVVTKLR